MSGDEEEQDLLRRDAGDNASDNEMWDGGTGDSSSPSAILRIMELNSDDNVEASSEVPQHTFDSSLPLAHNYLGGLTELSGRTLLEEDRIEDLSVLPHGHMVLVPGQTLPVTINDPSLVTMLRNSVAGGRTFGSVCVTQAQFQQPCVADIGTSAEIYAFQEMVGRGEVRLKAVGRQRFRIVDWGPPRHLSGYYQAKVKVLRERVLPDLRLLASPASWRRRRHRTARHVSALTPWPAWLHDLYDERKLVARITKFYDSPDIELPKNARPTVHIPTDPTELSFWVAQSLSLPDYLLLQLLRLDSPIQRLRWEISMINHCRVLCCGQCLREVGKWSDLFSMSAGGPQGLYVNPGGFLHETITLSRAEGLIVHRAKPSAEFSWFPGYGWTIVECADCDQHMGWLFTALEPGLVPQSFYGLCRRSITTKVSASSSGITIRRAVH